MLNRDNTIIYEDEYNIYDKLANEAQKEPGPKGFVKLYLKRKNDILYDDGSNLVVAQGREFVAQRISNCYTYSNGTRANWTDHKITHFGVGSGGSTISTNGQVTLNGPSIVDTKLISGIPLATQNYLTENATGGAVNCVKPIALHGGSVVLASQTYPYGVNPPLASYYTKIKCTCIVPGDVGGEPTSLLAGESQRIDEAGLYFVKNNEANLFAHICFAPKWKEKESILTIIWYILC